MIAHLYLYFGIVGIASILAWLGALALALNFAFHERRTFFFTRAVMLALIGILLAQINSANVSRIEVDHRQELKEARERQLKSQEAQMDTLQKRTANLRFAEDNTTDPLDLAGNPSADKRSAYEKAADEKSGDEQRKKTGRKRWQPIGAAATDDNQTLIADQGEFAEEERTVGRLLPQRDVDRADQLDFLNVWIARLVLFAVLLAFVLNYFSRFRRTVGAVLPLPISGRFVDALFPKKHSAVLRGGQPGFAQSYLETVVRKGECFVYCGETDLPLPPAIARVHLPMHALGRYFLEVIRPYFLLQLASRIGRIPVAGRPLKSRLAWPRGLAWARRLGTAVGRGVGRGVGSGIRILRILFRGIALPLRWLWNQLTAMAWWRRVVGIAWSPIGRVIHLAGGYGCQAGRPFRRLSTQFRNGIIEFHPVQIIPAISGPQSPSHNFIFECAWYNRYCFTVAGPERSTALVAAFRQFLGERLPPRASASTTIHLLWNCRTPLNPDLLQPLAVFSKEVNIKLMVFAAAAHIAEIGKWVEEVCPDEAPPRVHPSLLAFVMLRMRQITAHLQPWLKRQRQQIKARRERVSAERAAKAAAAKATTPAAKPKSPAKAPVALIPKPVADVKASAPAPMPTPAPVPMPAKAPAPTPAVSPKLKAPQPQPAPVPTVLPKVKAAQPAVIASPKPMPKVAAPQPKVKPSVMPIAKAPSVTGVADFNEIKLKLPEEPLHIILAPKIKIKMPPAAAPARSGVEGPALSRPVVSGSAGSPSQAKSRDKVEPVEGLAAPVCSAAESKPAEPAPTPPPAALPEKQPVPEPKILPPEPAKTLIPLPPLSAPAEEPKKPKPPAEAQASSSPIAEVNQAAGVLKFYCPACRQKLSAQIDWQGKTISCPACKAQITIPTLI